MSTFLGQLFRTGSKLASVSTVSAPKIDSSGTNPIFASTIALSAFLLFQVQLVIGKSILPWFGGTAAVWTTCMLVFQLLLLAGYAYAHLLSSKLSLRRQALVHTALLGIAIIALAFGAVYWRAPILPPDTWKPQADGSPVWEIIRMLLATVAIPFFVLSTTGSLVQRWFAHAFPGTSPYRLYSLSNFGSLLGLLCYPFVIEPMLSLRAQAWLWTGSFLVFAALCALTARRAASANTVGEFKKEEVDDAEEEPALLRYTLWLVLPACASAMLLATTNHICQDVAVIPFLWIVPLCSYLFSFILTFDTPKWYRRGFFHPLFVLSVVFAVFGLVHEYSVVAEISLALIAMFAVCMVMHGELVRLRPRTKHLTAFYLMVSAGGALGGVFVSIVAPLIFPDFWEYQVSLFLCGLFAFCVLWLDKKSWLYTSRLSTGIVALFAMAMVPLLGARYVDRDFFGRLNGTPYDVGLAVLGILVAVAIIHDLRTSRAAEARSNVPVQLAAFLVLASLGTLLGAQILYQPDAVVERKRSFFGVRTLFKTEQALVLRHGATIHGWQYFDPGRRMVPTAYYIPETGIGLLMANYPRSGRGTQASSEGLRIGVVGLGVGTLATYGLPDDFIRFYEIDKQIVDFSMSEKPRFTYLKGSRATIDVKLGDGRLSLEREEPQQYDILVLDAFSSDAVPVHLLTKEAMQIYRNHLSGPRAVIAFNVTNRLLDLRPVLVGLARDSGMHMVSAGVYRPNVPVRWVLMCKDRDFLLSIPGVRETARDVNLSAQPPLWTDDYSNLVQVMQF
jgi:hypothetical protein